MVGCHASHVDNPIAGSDGDAGTTNFEISLYRTSEWAGSLQKGTKDTSHTRSAVQHKPIEPIEPPFDPTQSPPMPTPHYPKELWTILGKHGEKEDRWFHRNLLGNRPVGVS